MEFTLDTAAMNQKRDELLSSVREALGDASDQAETVLDIFVQMTPPRDPPRLLSFSVKGGGKKGGLSRKAGNIILNWKKLAGSAPAILGSGLGASTGFGTTTGCWTAVFAGLCILQQLDSLFKIELSKEMATCLFALWHRGDENREITIKTANEACRELFATYQWDKPTDFELKEIFDNLAAIKCLKQNGDRIKLIEQLRWSYV
ncbi:hypothetical protein N9V88_00410 [bacterium]|nr:hypothetical protein [bacterium]